MDGGPSRFSAAVIDEDLAELADLLAIGTDHGAADKA